MMLGIKIKNLTVSLGTPHDVCSLISTHKVGWLSFTSHRQRGHLEMAPPFPVPCEGRGAQ